MRMSLRWRACSPPQATSTSLRPLLIPMLPAHYQRQHPSRSQSPFPVRAGRAAVGARPAAHVVRKCGPLWGVRTARAQLSFQGMLIAIPWPPTALATGPKLWKKRQ
eukprot:9017391-Pyramimonas_sp.AAC.1